MIKWRRFYDWVALGVFLVAVVVTVRRLDRPRLVETRIGSSVYDSFLITGRVVVVTYRATNGPLVRTDYGWWSAGGGVYGLLVITNLY